MRKLALLLTLLIMQISISCSTKPEPLIYGKDSCYFCKMTLVDKKFGAELVTTKGKVYKFDDLNCFINFYNSGIEGHRSVKLKLVIDYVHPEKFLNADEAFYLKSSSLRSPMNSEVAAFEDKPTLDKFKKELNGIYLAWGELITQFK